MRADLLKEVERIPLYERKPVYIDGVRQENFDGILEQGQKQALAVVSRRYALVQIREAFRRVLEACPEVEGWETLWLSRLFVRLERVGKSG